MTLALDREKVLAWLTQRVPAARITHILGVEQTAGDLARRYGLDEAKARSAGLLHDAAKYFKPQMLLQMAQNEGLELDSVLEAHPHLLHADASAIVARDEFGVVDREILDAIANHTLGRPNMSQLSCTVFVADTIEPSRGNTASLEALRETSCQNLYAAVWQTSDDSLKYLVETRCYIHPRTVLTRNWALQMARAESREIGNSTSKSIEQIKS
ncbi:MAG: bis(5'-nucleosyl)-tetraphosphatase (symmetrical) YqeK [Microcoleus sp. PH2017_22_RUC_O_B]|uniref:bis(5'-nucleosyl)-tetraphosphatase (symmetrical) YqeK n=1 Tax=unclassified Microcoleus TaxID=2642155 RepID=UPI001E0AC013|nr:MULTISPECIES: bis(5'-nucleosyl)-tetraphosphatase (symmetrical) YqeK [unclassified Microcoleus]MCC3527850.1 bis(5'-nucleosyl)-tetraphosphatase (symmetrical) YqeK [Microcoleus sp. PH2017_21_RUC_O_A]MCC3539922.1 bis(5'-nucleosyl)-tetraphosphatase (symmetrical) YqeK [Microcoleus sp. PH2017_22_RUC_O_B]